MHPCRPAAGSAGNACCESPHRVTLRPLMESPAAMTGRQRTRAATFETAARCRGFICGEGGSAQANDCHGILLVDLLITSSLVARQTIRSNCCADQLGSLAWDVDIDKTLGVQLTQLAVDDRNVAARDRWLRQPRGLGHLYEHECAILYRSSEVPLGYAKEEIELVGQQVDAFEACVYRSYQRVESDPRYRTHVRREVRTAWRPVCERHLNGHSWRRHTHRQGDRWVAR